MPTRKNYQQEQDGTLLKKAAFLADFRNHGIISEACRNADVGRTTVFRWQQDDILFEAKMEEAKRESIEALEQEARRRAFNGSDTLLIFLMKGELPDKYRDRLTVKDESPDLSKLNADELRQYRELLSKTSQTKV